MPIAAPKKIRIFLSCPGDLGEEKAAVTQIVLDANATWARRLNCELSVWDWQTSAQSRIAGDDAQTELFRQLGIYEIYIGMMWGRFGTPTKHAGSGTIEEFEKARYLNRISSGNVPLLKFFFKTAPLRLRTTTDLEQYSQVLAFRNDVQKNGLVETFETPGDFKYQLCISLMRALEEYIEGTVALSTKPVFLYYLDHFFLEMLRARKAPTETVSRETLLGAKVGYLLAGRVAVSASSFVESELCRSVIEKFAELKLKDRLPVLIAGSGENLEAYKSSTASHRTNKHGSLYRRKDKSVEIPQHAEFVPRTQSATAYILEHWLRKYSSGAYDEDIRSLSRLASVDEMALRERWAKLPELMKDMDIIVPQVVPVLFGKTVRKPAVDGALHRIINKLYFDSIQSEFDFAIVADLPSLRAQITPKATAKISFAEAGQFLREADLFETISDCPFGDLEALRQSEAWQSALRRILLLFSESR
jgi:hypothetical protein